MAISKTLVLVLDGSSSIRFFAAETRDGLSEHFIGLPVDRI